MMVLSRRDFYHMYTCAFFRVQTLVQNVIVHTFLRSEIVPARHFNNGSFSKFLNIFSEIWEITPEIKTVNTVRRVVRF